VDCAFNGVIGAKAPARTMDMSFSFTIAIPSGVSNHHHEQKRILCNSTKSAHNAFLDINDNAGQLDRRAVGLNCEKRKFRLQLWRRPVLDDKARL
jgi:hypothetical protein